jgi:phosphatidylglycerol:prolipoprotein diacylglycerol transferase
MHPIALRLGAFEISSYGVMLAVAMVLGMYLARRRAVLDDISPTVIDPLSIWIFASAMVGARVLYTFVEHPDIYFRYPLRFFLFREGGLSFFGGLFFAIAASIVFCLKRKIDFWALADVVTPSIALGLAIAKIGCFLAGCCQGGLCDLPWAVVFTDPHSLAEPKGVPLHPAQLYEAFANFLIFLLVMRFRRFRRTNGEVFFLFLVVYAVVRSALETLRGAPGHLGVLTTAQFLSIPMGTIALVWWIVRRRAAGRN